MGPCCSIQDMNSQLTSSQAARILGLSTERVRQLADQGQLRCADTPLGRLFASDDVEALRVKRSERLKEDTSE